MKVELNSELINKEITEYPCLGISKNNIIVLFHKKECGIVVSIGDGAWKLGDYSISWDMSCFTLYQDKVTLSNE